MPTCLPSPSSSTSSGFSDLDRLWETSLSQSQLASADSSAGGTLLGHPPKPCPPRKRRRLLASSSSSPSLRVASTASSSSKSEAELDEADGDEDGSSLVDGIDIAFSASLSLPACTPLAEQGHLQPGDIDFSLVKEALLSEGTLSTGGSSNSSSGDEVDDGLSDDLDDDVAWDAAFSILVTDDQPASESQAAGSTRDERRALAKAYIEDLLLSTLHQIAAHVGGCLTGAGSEDVEKASDRPSSSDTILLSFGPVDGSFTWPQRRGAGANSRQFARIWCVLALVHQGLEQGTTSTKRELFYANPALFGSQSNVDRIIDRIVAPSGLRRGDFGVIASPKGLFASTAIDLVLTDDEGTISSQGLPTLIPPIETIAEVVTAGAGDLEAFDDDNADDAEPKLVLIIEKDATFQALCETGWGSGRVVLVTGKGFPDLSTRHFAAFLAERFPFAPIYGLFDGDPDGIEILSCYRLGSREQACSAEERELPLERMQWLGVKPSEWGRLDIDWDLMLPLTERDHKKIVSMLARPPERLPEDWRKELCHMQHLRRKAEIQLLQSVAQTPSAQPSASLFGASGPTAGASLGGIDRLVAYLNAKTGLGGSHIGSLGYG